MKCAGSETIAAYQLDERAPAQFAKRRLKAKWLAIGIFYDFEHLTNVLRELMAAGFGDDKFCIARLPGSRQWAEGRSEALDEGSEAFGRLLYDYRELRCQHDGILYRVSNAFLAYELCESDAGTATEIMCPAWMGRVQREQLAHQLQCGAAALIVRSDSSQEQDTSSRVLLRHSQHTVRTYDFSN
jgi:hypothetical protein